MRFFGYTGGVTELGFLSQVPVLRCAWMSTNPSVDQTEKPTAMTAIFRWYVALSINSGSFGGKHIFLIEVYYEPRLLVIPVPQSHKPMRANVQVFR